MMKRFKVTYYQRVDCKNCLNRQIQRDKIVYASNERQARVRFARTVNHTHIVGIEEIGAERL